MTGPRRPPGATLREMCGYQWVCTPSRTSAAVAMGLSALVHQAAASWPSRFVAAQPDGALLAGQLLHMVCIFPIAGGRTLGWVESGLEQIVAALGVQHLHGALASQVTARATHSACPGWC